jgi:O-acetyl-ADP-ribose deacetylase (regulator of RNase III)
MIQIRLAELKDVEAECLVRSVSSELDPITAVSKDLELSAGSGVSDRLQAMGRMPVGAAVLTPAGDLRALFLVHVVLQSSEEPILQDGVRVALQNGLRRVQEWGVDTMAVPVLGIGAGNLSVEESAETMVPLMEEHLQRSEYPQLVTVVVSNEYEEEVFNRAAELARRQSSAWEQ